MKKIYEIPSGLPLQSDMQG